MHVSVRGDQGLRGPGRRSTERVSGGCPPDLGQVISAVMLIVSGSCTECLVQHELRVGLSAGLSCRRDGGRDDANRSGSQTLQDGWHTHPGAMSISSVW